METKKITPSQVLRSKEYANILKATLMEIKASHEIPASKGLVFRRSIYDSLKNELFVEGIEKTFPKTYKSIKEKRDRIHSSRERNFLLQLGDFVYEKSLSLLQQTQKINQNDKTDNHKEGD